MIYEQNECLMQNKSLPVKISELTKTRKNRISDLFAMICSFKTILALKVVSE